MVKINPYLNFNGNTEEAFSFYKSVFGGEFLAIQRFKDAPGCEGMKPADQEKILAYCTIHRWQYLNGNRCDVTHFSSHLWYRNFDFYRCGA